MVDLPRKTDGFQGSLDDFFVKTSAFRCNDLQVQKFEKLNGIRNGWNWKQRQEKVIVVTLLRNPNRILVFEDDTMLPSFEQVLDLDDFLLSQARIVESGQLRLTGRERMQLAIFFQK